MALFENLNLRARDEFEVGMVPQCSSYCMSQENGIGSQLQLVVQQWLQNVVVKEDVKQIKIASDLRKQVKVRICENPTKIKYFHRYLRSRGPEMTAMSQIMNGIRKERSIPIGQESGQINPRNTDSHTKKIFFQTALFDTTWSIFCPIKF